MSMDDDIALLKTDKSLRAFRMGLQVLPICEEARDSGTILGTCGMGSQSNDRILMYPSVLQETHYLDAYMPDCPPRQLCTESFIDKSSICVYDQGWEPQANETNYLSFFKKKIRLKKSRLEGHLIIFFFCLPWGGGGGGG